MVNKRTWFAHMFRTQGGDFGFPYPISGRQVDKARKYSQEIWRNNKWDKAIFDLDWLIKRFNPPGWGVSKGIIYYTDNRLEPGIMDACQKKLEETGLPIVSASLEPIPFGDNIHLPLERGYLTMAKQILAALERSTADVVYFCEHDVLYHSSHFEFTPARSDVYYYNTHVWKVPHDDGHALHYICQQLSGLCGYRTFLVEHFRKRVKRIEAEGFSRRMGFEPGTHNRPERIDDYRAESWRSAAPNIDIRHGGNLTQSRWKQEQFRNKRFCEGWTEAQVIEGWGHVDEIRKQFTNNKRR
jgi:hypothetical protein